MTEWQIAKLSELATIKYGKNQKDVTVECGNIPIYGTGGIMGYASKALYDKPSVLIGRKGTIDKVRYVTKPFWTVDTTFYTIIDDSKILPRYFYYLLSLVDLSLYNEGTTIPSLRTETLNRLEFYLPPLEIQNKIVSILGALDDKIELNQRQNNNLEQQAQALFNEMFLGDISNVHSRHHLLLSELVQNIDNRGKTPPLSPKKTDFPIIDVKALSGNTRIINYDNCTKFVSQETYLTGFRSGLPKKYDILLSTVGSLGEIKLFIEPKGCIAQNVIGYRSKISPLYIYQYLRTIRNDLLAYDIGSVQPSIKVTHIAKHPIFIPNEDKLKEFHSIAEAITNKIYVNSQENTRLAAIRDALLPKLMSGEIDVSNVDISALTSTDKLSFTEE